MGSATSVSDDDISHVPREAKILACRRALALMLKHHGSIPPERGCSAEAIEIRRRFAAKASAPTGLAELLAAVCARYCVTEADIRGRRGDGNVMAARRRLFLRAHEQLGMSTAAIGAEFGRSQVTVWQTIRDAKAHGADMTGAISEAMRAFVDEARSVPIDGEAGRRGLKLKRAGAELIGPCPVCGGHDRFSINPRKGVFLCRFAGRGGDVIEMTEYLDGVNFIRACETLTGRPAPSGESIGPDPDEIARRAATRAEAEAKRARAEFDYREAERARMHRVWLACDRDIPGTPVARYLALRGIGIKTIVGTAIRSHPGLPYFVLDNQRQREVHRGPAMVAAIVDAGGRFRGAHLTWIDQDLSTEDGKALIVDPESGEVLPPKKVRGSMSGNHIPLSKCAAPRRLVIGEGNETGLSAKDACLAEMPSDWIDETIFWSGISLGNLGGRAEATTAHPTATRSDKLGRERALRVPNDVPAEEPGKPALMPPASIDEIILLGDGDSDRFATEMALKRAAARWTRPGRVIRAAWAPDGHDWNDVLRGV